MIYKENFQLDKVAYIASPKGAKMDYVQKLQVKMKEQESDEGYIKLCSDYAQRLIDNDVPVVFDYRHLSLLLGLEPSEIAFYLFADESLFYKETPLYNFFKKNNVQDDFRVIISLPKIHNKGK